MKKLVLLLLLPFIGFGQSVSAPDSKSFLLNTSGQDASGFVVNGFNSTTTLLTSISLINPPAGTTFILNSISGLTPASGFTLSGNKTRLVVTGTPLNINSALANLKINTGGTSGTIQLSVAATINPTGYFYNGVNGHFYQPVSTGTTYTNARAASLNATFKGQNGYLVTITSPDEDTFIFNNVPQSNIWFALTDEVTEGRWVIDAGPERNTLIKTSNGQFSGNLQGQYNNWAPGEPNNSGNEDYAVTKWNGSQWNDLPNNFWNPYVIEYGTWTNPDDQTFTEFYSNSTSHTVGNVFSVRFTFNFGSLIDETKFSTKMFHTPQSSTTPLPITSNNYIPLNGLGKVDMTSDSDINRTGVSIFFAPYNTSALTALYDQIVTVSDVFIAFKEVANTGLMGNQTGNEFGSGLQYMNADIDSNGTFNESDCFRLLQHLTGTKQLVDTFNLASTMTIMERDQVNLINKDNWNTFSTSPRDNYPITFTQGVLSYNYNLNVSWKGDVNLSHTPSQTVVGKFGTLSAKSSTNEIQAYIETEQVDGKVYATIKVDPLQHQVVGTQFRLNYDNTILTFEKVESKAKATNFGVNRGEYVNLGSLISDSTSTLDNTTEYRVIFKLNKPVENILGLISVSNTDAVNSNGIQLKIKMI
jgi:hypothetical protein